MRGSNICYRSGEGLPDICVLLWGSKISNSGAAAVAETLSSGGCASTLSAFCILGGGISDSGAKKAMDAMRGCTRLSDFYIGVNPISGETLMYILGRIAGVSTIRSVNLCIGEFSKEQMDSCLDRLQQSGVAKQLKIRFLCDTDTVLSVCEEFGAEWDARLAEFMIVSSFSHFFADELIIGMPK